MNRFSGCRYDSSGAGRISLVADVRYDSAIPDFAALDVEHRLLWPRLKDMHPEIAEFGKPELRRLPGERDAVRFTFRVRPYDEKVNGLFRYVRDLGELLAVPEKTPEPVPSLQSRLRKYGII